MQHEHRHAVWTCACGIEFDVEFDMGIQHGHGQEHAAWKLTCSMDLDIQHGNGHGHAAWELTCSMDMDMQNGHGHAQDADIVHGLEYAACPCPWCMSTPMLHVLAHVAWT
jgi:hypothetical protein